MTQVVIMVIQFIANLVINALALILVLLMPFVVMAIIRYCYYRKKGYKVAQRSKLSTYHRTSIFKKLFYEFPDRFVKDIFQRNPDDFPYCGLIMVCGEQGAGKSITTVHMAQVLKKMFPNVLLKTNINVSFQDGLIESPDDIILQDNGFNGCIKVLDEIQNWFNSMESANFPPEMLGEICQQRKQHSLFIGTSQRFSKISKAIRQQTSYIVLPITILNCLTFVRVYRPTIDESGEVKKMKRVKTYFFVQSDELRNSYDTYEKVKRLSLKGWKPRSEQLTDEEASAPVVIVTDNIKKQCKK